MLDEHDKHGEALNLGEEPVKEDSDRNNSATAEAFRRIRALHGTATRVVVKRRSPQGKYQYVRGASVTFDPPQVNFQIKERRKANVPTRKPGPEHQAR